MSLNIKYMYFGLSIYVLFSFCLVNGIIFITCKVAVYPRYLITKLDLGTDVHTMPADFDINYSLNF